MLVSELISWCFIFLKVSVASKQSPGKSSVLHPHIGSSSSLESESLWNCTVTLVRKFKESWDRKAAAMKERRTRMETVIVKGMGIREENPETGTSYPF